MALTGLDWHLFNWRQLEFHGKLCFMKAGLVFADMLSTVSPTYAREIQTPEVWLGAGRAAPRPPGRPDGIVNGIDTEVWSPLHEPMLAARYDAATVVRGQGRVQGLAPAAGRAWPSARTSRVRPDRPARPQKGWDLLAEVADRLLERDVQLVVLGVGHPKYHALLEELAGRHAGKFWAYLGFADDLAHQIEAGADVFLMPSLFEPCGLNQLYSLAHGTVPIVRATGGLADTVVDANPGTSPTARPPASSSPSRPPRPSGRRSSGRWRSGPIATPG